MKPLVYLAGPYRSPDPVQNMHHAIKLGAQLLDDGVVTPLIPHLSGTWDMVTPRPAETWLAYDLELLARCDALLRFGGYSRGAAAEWRYACDEVDIPCFLDVEVLYAWAWSQ